MCIRDRGNIHHAHTAGIGIYRQCLAAVRTITGGVFHGQVLQPGAAAASTPQGKPGYLFANCTVQGNSPAGSVYLGRPWRQYARVYWLDCNLSDEIIPLSLIHI